jgi:hypothetical protein
LLAAVYGSVIIFAAGTEYLYIITMKPLQAEYLFGKWDLFSFQLEFWSMKWNWGKNATGWIAYDRDGTMKVDIKAEKSVFPYIGQLIFNNELAYGGDYKIRDNLVIHHLDYSSKKSWIGKDLVREVLRLDKNNLALQGGSKSIQYTLVWTRSSPNPDTP